MAGLVVSLLAWLLPQEPRHTAAPLDVEINPIEYSIAATSWPNNDDDRVEDDREKLRDFEVANTHVYGYETGKFSYKLRIDRFTGDTVELRAQLSANSLYYDDRYSKSDVTITINGKHSKNIRVVPDDGKGDIYAWRFDRKFLNEDRVNTIEFSVDEDSDFRNGLCIYGDAVDPNIGVDKRITLRSD
jgi:hypothetical protein